jgi:hypothetical protein
MKRENIEIIVSEQSLYDGFNSFIMSDDVKVFGKLLARTLLFESVKNIPGDIVECGVFKGSGIYSFLKLKRYLCPNTSKKVIGFDMFNSEELINSLKSVDKEAMSELFNGRNFKHEQNYKNYLEANILSNGFLPHEFELIQGDISKTALKYVEENPGFKISLLYLDLDLGEPTYDTLCALWDRVSVGGLVIFDEYGFAKWSESEGVDRFFKDKNIEIISLNYICPTAYVKKIV